MMKSWEVKMPMNGGTKIVQAKFCTSAVAKAVGRMSGHHLEEWEDATPYIRRPNDLVQVRDLETGTVHYVDYVEHG